MSTHPQEYEWRCGDDWLSYHSHILQYSNVGAAAGLGHQAIMSDYGVDLPVRVWSDSSAALGIAKRTGLGRIRHLDTNTLWLQEKVRTGAIEVRKVKGEENPADLFTKHLPSQDNVHTLVKLFIVLALVNFCRIKEHQPRWMNFTRG